MQIRDRIRELRRVPARDLRPNPKNWRTHPAAQRNALRGILSEVGYAGALLAREADDGGLVLIDGHLRAETTPDMEVPVLVLDVNEAEADKLLATVDPLGAMAEADAANLDSLLREIDTGSEALSEMLAALAKSANLYDTADAGEPARPGQGSYSEQYGVIVICDDEAQQQEVYERLEADGFNCKVVVT